MIVEVAFGSISAKAAAQYLICQLLGCSLAIGAGNSDKGNIELLAVMRSKVLEGTEHIVDQNVFVASNHSRIIHYGIGCAVLQCLCGKVIAVKIATFEGEV